jgi:hypothetical protein
MKLGMVVSVQQVFFEFRWKVTMVIPAVGLRTDTPNFQKTDKIKSRNFSKQFQKIILKVMHILKEE